jgi:flagellin-specific chaperone FliS
LSLSADAYRSIDLSTAPARGLVLRAYDAAIRALEEAEEDLLAGRSGDEPLRRAQTIVAGLMSALDFRAGEIAEQFLRLYLFVLDRIQRTAEQRSDQGLGESREVLGTLRAGWAGMKSEESGPFPAPPRAHGFRAQG